jgi:hypothetical protein
MYLSLYKMHELALHGFAKVALDRPTHGTPSEAALTPVPPHSLAHTLFPIS